MSSNHVKNIAVIGGAGNLGIYIIKALLASGSFNVTAITREASTVTFPDTVKVIKGDYDTPGFLESALKGNEALILSVAFGPHILGAFQVRAAEAAAAAGVKWIMPAEYGNDNGNPTLEEMVPLNKLKRAVRERVEELGKGEDGPYWLGLATNPWFEFSYKMGNFLLNTSKKEVTLSSGGNAKFSTTLLATVGLAMARLFALPITASSPTTTTLSSYNNKFIYISSFAISQQDIFEATLRVTNTKREEWKITDVDAQEWMEEGKEMLARGEMMGMLKLIYGPHFRGGMGGLFTDKMLSNEVLGLPNGDLDAEIKRALAEKEAMNLEEYVQKAKEREQHIAGTT